MKLDSIKPTVIRTGEFENAQFGIGDLSVLLDILRSKMYSNSISAVSREIMSNARDAHREAGKQDVPIEVKIPNDLDPTFYVRDFGPGITPDRMANIFIQYGSSTKRDDNTQTGGFGLGAKTPFAYTDAFSVTSITPEKIFITKGGERFEDVMVKREYVAFIDETRIGSMSLICSVVTDEPQGTKISLTVPTGQRQDYDAFKKWVHHTAMYWQSVPDEPLPTILGCQDWSWVIPVRDTEGENWFFEGSKSYYRKDLSIIIDGIQFPVNTYNLGLKVNSPEEKVLNYAIRLIFEVGEISVTANREEIDYAKKTTCDIIKSRLGLIVTELQDQLSKKMETASSLWEAKCLWGKYSKEFEGIVKTVFWNGIEIDTSSIANRRYNCSASRFNKKYDGTISRKETGAIEFLENAILCIEDTGLKHPSKCRIQTLFDNNDKLDCVYVLRYPDEDAMRDKAVIDLEKEHNFSKLNATLLSTVDKSLVKRSSGGPTGTMTRVYSYSSNAYSSYRKSMLWNSTSLDLEEDSGIYVEIKNKNPIVNGVTLSFSCFENIISILKLGTVYGIPSRYLKKIGTDWEKLENVVADKIIELEKDPAIKTYIGESTSFCVMSALSYIGKLLSSQEMIDAIEDKKSLFLEYITASKDVESVKSKLLVIDNLKNNIKNNPYSPQVENKNGKISKLKASVREKYPLLFAANSWEGANLSDEEYANYINLVDAN